MEIPDIKMLVQFGKLGVAMMMARILSIVALLGVIALSCYIIYAPSWQGAACVGVLAIFCFVPALKAESSRSAQKEE